ncbi:MAG TPA: hypothetical protein VMC06_05110 [Opitutaceae bacterium]|nr:hypothetical protein [Opitutaceae bacterium]
MKLAPLLLVGSLLANAAVVTTFALRPTLAPPALRDFFLSSSAKAEAESIARAQVQQAAAARARADTARGLASQALLWSALQSDDLPTLVARLRAAGFPASLVRAIVTAQVDTRFNARMKALAREVENTPFWKPRPTNSFNNPKYFEEMSQANRDRSKLLRELLGDDFFASSGVDPTTAQRRQFGDLSKSKIDLIQRINDDYAEMLSQVRAATNGITLPEDRAKMALLEREKHADLAAILTPQELEDYEMRNSPVTSRLRSAFSLMDATEDEFRIIYRIEQQFNDLNNPGYGVVSANTINSAETQIAAQLKAALGEARANEFLRAQNYEFQSLAQLAQRENLPIDAAVRAYDLRTSTSEESGRIFNDQSLTIDQKRAAMQTLAQNTRAQLIGTLGPTAGAAYASSALWLKAIEAGTYVRFDGRATIFRSLPTTNPPR